MTKPITSVAAMMLWEEGRFELTDEISRWLPEFADVRVYDKGSALQAVHGAGGRADPGLAPAHPHRRPDLRLPADLGGRRALPGRRLRPRTRRRASTWPRACAGLGRAAAAVPARHRAGATRSPPTCSAGWSRWSPGRAWTTFFAERILGPLGMTDTRWWVDGRRRRPAGRALRAEPAHRRRRSATTRSARWRCSKPDAALRRRRADLHRRRLPPLHPDAAARRRAATAYACSAPRTVRFMTRNHLPGGAGPGRAVHRRLRRDDLRRHRLRPRLRGGAGPGPEPGAEQRRASTTGAAWPAPRSGSTRPRSSPRCCSPS